MRILFWAALLAFVTWASYYSCLRGVCCDPIAAQCLEPVQYDSSHSGG